MLNFNTLKNLQKNLDAYVTADQTYKTANKAQHDSTQSYVNEGFGILEKTLTTVGDNSDTSAVSLDVNVIAAD